MYFYYYQIRLKKTFEYFFTSSFTLENISNNFILWNYLKFEYFYHKLHVFHVFDVFQ